MRKMASVQTICDKKAIDGADAIEAVKVNGWWVVAKKDEFNIGDIVVYCEIDSWIPTSIAPFLTKVGKAPKQYNNVSGERLRTVKLRGQLSQGIVFPFSILQDGQYEVGEDVSETLGIQKWEEPEYAGKRSSAKGNFPSFLIKTDQQRVQNIRDLQDHYGESFEVTIKIDGSSLTAFVNGDKEGVCSRNIELKDEEGNAFWDIAKKYTLLDRIRATGRSLAVQGELIAPNIQKNHEKRNSPEFYCFSIFDIDKQEYLLPAERVLLCSVYGIPHVKIVDKEFVLSHTVEELLDMAEGCGMFEGVQREGLVFKSNHSQFSFKAVANSYLLKKG